MLHRAFFTYLLSSTNKCTILRLKCRSKYCHIKDCYLCNFNRNIVHLLVLVNRNLQRLYVTNLVQAYCSLVFVFSSHTVKLPLVFPSTLSNYVTCSFQEHCLLALYLSKHTVYLPLFPSKHSTFVPSKLLTLYLYLFFPDTLSYKPIQPKSHASDELIKKMQINMELRKSNTFLPFIVNITNIVWS